MRIFKKILGAFLLLIIAGLVLGPTIIQYGWIAAIATVLVAVIAVAILLVGIHLLIDD